MKSTPGWSPSFPRRRSGSSRGWTSTLTRSSARCWAQAREEGDFAGLLDFFEYRQATIDNMDY